MSSSWPSCSATPGESHLVGVRAGDRPPVLRRQAGMLAVNAAVAAAPIDPTRLGVSDAGEILTLQRAAYVTEAQAHDDLGMPPLTQTLDQLREELTDRDVTAWGIREHGRLVASVRVRLTGPDAAEVGRLTVAPDRQGNGLGSALLLAAEARLRDEVTVIRLFTGERSTANLRLYARLGYHETERSPAGDYQLVHLVKSRAPARASGLQNGS